MHEMLPTRQLNALRVLLEKSDLTPEEISHLSYRRLLKSPGIGRKGVEIIRAWLAQYHLNLAELPVTDGDVNAGLLPKRVQQAIQLLEKYGFAVSKA